MTNDQKRLRNWQKMRLIGFNLDSDVLTEVEQRMWFEASERLMMLLESWDSQTEVLIGHPLLPHRCCSCNKRVDGRYMIAEEGEGWNNLYFCNKHHEQYHAEQRQIRTPIRGLVGED